MLAKPIEQIVDRWVRNKTATVQRVAELDTAVFVTGTDQEVSLVEVAGHAFAWLAFPLISPLQRGRDREYLLCFTTPTTLDELGR